MDVSRALSWCLLAAVLSAATAGSLQGGSRSLFPVTVTLEEGAACTTHSGAPARCTDIRHCDFTILDFRHNPPVRCGFQGIFPVVCCPAVPRVGPQPVTDIAPPPPTFQCGKNSRNLLTSSFTVLDVERKIYIEPEDFPFVKDFIATRNFEHREDFEPPIAVEAIGSVMALENAWPWMALVGERQGEEITWFCGAVLINEHWVLSALHCFFDKKPEVVRLGEHNYKDDNDGADHQDFGVTEILPYPGYTHPEAYHDLALLRLASRVPLQEFISPVCLPWGAESEVDITGHQATLTGYGDTELGGIPTSYLQEVNMTVFSSARCDTSYSNLPHYAETWPQGIGQETLCAGHPDGGRDACQGDSGGPLMSQDTNGLFVLAGIVSQGYGCGHKDYPGQYANLRYPPYLAWIKKVAFTVF